MLPHQLCVVVSGLAPASSKRPLSPKCLFGRGTRAFKISAVMNRSLDSSKWPDHGSNQTVLSMPCFDEHASSIDSSKWPNYGLNQTVLSVPCFDTFRLPSTKSNQFLLSWHFTRHIILLSLRLGEQTRKPSFSLTG